jgi:hypothetical protein
MILDPSHITMRKKAALKKNSNNTKKLNKQLMLVSIKYIAETIVAEKEKYGGRVPWGFAAKLLEEGKETFPCMSMRSMNNYVNKIEKSETIDKELCGSNLVDKCSATNITTVSSLTKDVALMPTTSNTASDNEVAIVIPRHQIVALHMALWTVNLKWNLSD